MIDRCWTQDEDGGFSFILVDDTVVACIVADCKFLKDGRGIHYQALVIFGGLWTSWERRIPWVHVEIDSLSLIDRMNDNI